MVLKTYNFSLLERFRHIFNFKRGQSLPPQIGEIIVPVVNEPMTKHIQIANATASDSVSATIMTTSKDKRTFLVGTSLSVSKDSNNDGTFSHMQCTPLHGKLKTFILLRYEGLTAGQHSVNNNYAPIELEPGTTVNVLNATATASIDAGGVIMYYEEEL